MEPVTVVVCTRNRGESVLRTVRTVLANEHPAWGLRIIDQSDDDRTARAVQPFLADPRIDYHRCRRVGLALARNVGVREAPTELVAVTDDDCEVAPDWLVEIDAAFAHDVRIALVFGNILPGPHERAQGFVPAYVRFANTLARGIADKNRVQGAGACMALRRSAWAAIGGFDETLGMGAPLLSAEETDFTLRALLAGYFVYETPLARVVHHGFYAWERHPAAVHTYWYGTGAAFARSFSAHPIAVGRVLAGLAAGWAVRSSPVAASMEGRPHRWRRLVAFARGFAAGLVTPACLPATTEAKGGV